MRHNRYKYKLSVSPDHRQALMKNLCVELFDHKQIKTTVTRAKALKSYAEKLVTIAKEDSVANRRLVFSKINDKAAVKTLFDDIAPKFKERPGGYTRLLKVADARLGDGAKMAYLTFVD